jgi:hypothetical protein
MITLDLALHGSLKRSLLPTKEPINNGSSYAEDGLQRMKTTDKLSERFQQAQRMAKQVHH